MAVLLNPGHVAGRLPTDVLLGRSGGQATCSGGRAVGARHRCCVVRRAGTLALILKPPAGVVFAPSTAGDSTEIEHADV
jgi:hypothetical protein